MGNEPLGVAQRSPRDTEQADAGNAELQFIKRRM